eukprot:10025330-Prorocentrum_lima.AAC.1
MTSSLVGSEMCIRDRGSSMLSSSSVDMGAACGEDCAGTPRSVVARGVCPVSYTHLTLPTICSV